MRRNLEWWDNASVPKDQAKANKACEWMALNAPKLHEHDYALYTDGSGHKDGVGASAALYQSTREGADGMAIALSMTYGQTVRRSELGAMLDGIHSIIDSELNYKISTGEVELRSPASKTKEVLRGPGRLRVAWYTDRKDLASAMMYTDEDKLVNNRTGDEDLWARWSAYKQYVVVTPLYSARNTVIMQAAADSLCTLGRETMKRTIEELKQSNTQLWIPKSISQRALM